MIVSFVLYHCINDCINDCTILEDPGSVSRSLPTDCPWVSEDAFKLNGVRSVILLYVVLFNVNAFSFVL